MRKLTSFMAMAGIAASALGQNVIVVMNDGTSHKFNADYIKEIRFAEGETPDESVRFDKVSMEVYGYGNVSLIFSDATGENIAELDVYGSENAFCLEPGTYNVEASMNEFTIDPGAYSSLTINGNRLSLASGEMTVTAGDRTYDITMDLVANDGSTIKGTYTGNLPSTYSLWPSMTMQQASYNDNPQPAGDFYVKFSGSGENSNSWESAFVFTADAADTLLPEGTYTYSEGHEPFTFGPASYLDTFRPSSNNRFAPGSEITVKKEGDDYVITMNLNFIDGREAEVSFNGQISGTPTFSQPQTGGMVFDRMSYRMYGSTNFCPMFFKDNGETMITLDLDMYAPEAASLVTGTYTVGADEGLYISTEFSGYSVDDQTTKIKSGTVTVSDNNGVYTFEIDITLSNGSPIKGRYEGRIGGAYSSVVYVDADYAAYNDNPRPAGEFYVKFNAMDPQSETAFDIFGDPEASTLPAGKYVYSTDNTPGTFGPKSYVDFYTPHSNNKMKEGSEINVSVEGDVYTVEMTLLFEDGRTTYLNYNGKIEGAPVFE